jgi:hypothetical protein
MHNELTPSRKDGVSFFLILQNLPSLLNLPYLEKREKCQIKLLENRSWFFSI